MKHATTAHNPLVGGVGLLFHFQGQILFQLLGQTVGYVPAGAELAFLAEERRVVDGEEHRHGRLVNADGRKRFRLLKVAYRVADFKVCQTNDGTNVTTRHTFSGAVSHTLKSVEFLDFRLLLTAVAVADGHVHAASQCTTMNTSDGDSPGIGGIIQRSDEHLRSALESLWSRDGLDDGVEQILDIIGRLRPVLPHPALLGRTINHREVQLVFCGVEVAHQVEHHFIHLFRSAVRFVNLIHHDNWLQTDFKRFLKHESRLRHRTLESIHQQDTSVCHVQHTLHLTTEVAVSRSVYHIDLHSFVVD